MIGELERLIASAPSSPEPPKPRETALVTLNSCIAKKPYYATDESAGLELFSVEELIIEPGELMKVDTGISIKCPKGTYGRISPKSGVTTKKMLDVKAGVIDADYTGPIIVCLHNFGEHHQYIGKGERIAQLIFTPYVSCDLTLVNNLEKTVRGAGGFGSTGTH